MDNAHRKLNFSSFLSQYKPKYDVEKIQRLRKAFIESELTDAQKMELYKAGTENKLSDLKLLVYKNYSLMEECSQAGFYWTVLHYAANYGFTEIVEYVLRYYTNNPNISEICNLQSNLGMSPLFLALKNCSDSGKKKRY